MVGMKSFSEAISFVISNPKIILIPLIFLLILAPLNAYVQHKNPITNLENFEKEGVVFEEYGASKELSPEQLRLILVLALLQLLLLSAAQYSVVIYSEAKIRGGEVSFIDAIISGLENVIPAFIMNVLLTVILVTVIIVVAIPFTLILGIGALGNSKSLITLGILLLFGAEFIAMALLIGALSVAFPGYVLTGSIRKGLRAIALPLNRMKSTFGFGLLLLLSIFALYMAAGIVFFTVLLISRSFVGILVGVILQSPIMALINAFLSVAGLTFYRNLSEELLNSVQSTMTDVRTY